MMIGRLSPLKMLSTFDGPGHGGQSRLRAASKLVRLRGACFNLLSTERHRETALSNLFQSKLWGSVSWQVQK